MLYLLLRSLTGWLDQIGLYSVFGLLDQVEFRALAAALLSFALVLGFGRPVIRWLRAKKIGDTGLSDAADLAAHAASKANTPTMGGVLLIGAIAVSCLLLADISKFYVQAGLIIMLVHAGIGAMDDYLKLTAKHRPENSRQGLYAWEKLVFQLGLAGVIVFFCSRQDSGPLTTVLNLPFQRSYVPGAEEGQVEPGLTILPVAAYVLIGMLLITWTSNASNLTDGMDGLAAGVCGLIGVGLFVLALIAGSMFAYKLLVPRITGAEELAVMAASMSGACLGFLWWNCNPASVFMGDTGSLALGALIAYIAVVIRQEFVVLLMAVVFIIEAGSVMLQVGYFKLTKGPSGQGKRIFRRAPFHHHLHLCLWTETQVVARFWIITMLCVILGLASVKIR